MGGDLYVLDDITYDEVTGKNLNITGVATIAALGVTGVTTIGNVVTYGNTTGVPVTLSRGGCIITTDDYLYDGEDLYIKDDIKINNSTATYE